ncbi:hypothetical protein C8J55DRAFT_493842 [Lentinula edodes]|uniref:Uncharacterized protein n=1 Tax=Lentinula lateritia TaxID=40482 RepID=A0A9W9DE53_9AGAR|nr:hypothetical protein C8J55DRAFT_493842 [Lentinula edodes]
MSRTNLLCQIIRSPANWTSDLHILCNVMPAPLPGQSALPSAPSSTTGGQGKLFLRKRRQGVGSRCTRFHYQKADILITGSAAGGGKEEGATAKLIGWDTADTAPPPPPRRRRRSRNPPPNSRNALGVGYVGPSVEVKRERGMGVGMGLSGGYGGMGSTLGSAILSAIPQTPTTPTIRFGTPAPTAGRGKRLKLRLRLVEGLENDDQSM